MNENYTGGCACGAIRYEIRGEPIAMNDCQCRQCQHRSGTGRGSYLAFASREQAVQLVGDARHWDVTGESGTVKRHAFCPTCGSPVYLTIPKAPDLFIVHAASLDQPARYQPQFVTYGSSAQAWDPVAPGLRRFEKMPA